MADPAMAPSDAGPAPARKAWTRRLARSWSKRGPPASTKTNDGAKATAAASRPPTRPAAAYPTTATVWTTGPGVIWPSATASRNWLAVIQW